MSLLTLDQAVELSGRPKTSIEQARIRGAIAAKKVDGVFRLDEDSFTKWNASARRYPQASGSANGGLTIQEAANMIGMHHVTVFGAVQAGKIKAKRVKRPRGGGPMYILDRESFEAWAKDRKPGRKGVNAGTHANGHANGHKRAHPRKKAGEPVVEAFSASLVALVRSAVRAELRNAFGD